MYCNFFKCELSSNYACLLCSVNCIHSLNKEEKNYLIDCTQKKYNSNEDVYIDSRIISESFIDVINGNIQICTSRFTSHESFNHFITVFLAIEMRLNVFLSHCNSESSKQSFKCEKTYKFDDFCNTKIKCLFKIYESYFLYDSVMWFDSITGTPTDIYSHFYKKIK